MTFEGVHARITGFAESHEHDIQDLYALLEDAQDSRTGLSQNIDLLMGDRVIIKETIWAVEEEAYQSRVAWSQLWR